MCATSCVLLAVVVDVPSESCSPAFDSVLWLAASSETAGITVGGRCDTVGSEWHSVSAVQTPHQHARLTHVREVRKGSGDFRGLFCPSSAPLSFSSVINQSHGSTRARSYIERCIAGSVHGVLLGVSEARLNQTRLSFISHSLTPTHTQQQRHVVLLRERRASSRRMHALWTRGRLSRRCSGGEHSIYALRRVP